MSSPCNAGIWRKFAAELLGSLGITLTVGIVAASIDAPNSPILASGCFLAAFYAAFASVSGVHLNPAVTVGVGIYRGVVEGCSQVLLVELIGYVISQFCGCLIGGACAGALLNHMSETLTVTPVEVFPFKDHYEQVSDFSLEMIGAFFFMLTQLRVCYSKNNDNVLIKGLIIGCAFTFALLINHSLKGEGLNPAMDTGLWISNILAGHDGDDSLVMYHFLDYYVATIVGSALAAAVHCGYELSAEN